MKLAVSNIAWNQEEEEAVFSRLQFLGIRYLEVAPSKLFKNIFEVPENRIDDIVNKIEKYDLSIVSFQSLFYQFGDVNIFFQPNECFKILEQLAKIAAQLNCKNLVFGSPKNRDIKSLSKEDVDNLSTQFFRKVGDFLHPFGIVLSLEPNPIIYNANFLVATLEALTYLKKLDHPNIKLNLDLGTVISNKEILHQIFLTGIEFINHIHLSQPHLTPVQSSHYLKECIQLAQFFHYKGFISLEMKESESFFKTIRLIKSFIPND